MRTAMYFRPGSCAILAAAAGLCAVVGTTHGQVTATWLTASSGNWSDATRWSTNPDFPNNGAQTYNAVITATGAAYTVTLDQNIEVTDFTLDSADAAFEFGGAFTLRVRGNWLSGATATVDGLGNGGSIQVDGITTFQGGTIRNAGTLLSLGPVHYSNSTTVTIDDTDVDHGNGSALWDQPGDIVLQNGATITNGSTSVFTISNNQQMTFSNIGASPTFSNSGRIVKTSSGLTETQGVTFTNTGIVEVEAGIFRTDGVATPGNVLTAGHLIVKDNATLDFVGASILTNQSIVELEGLNSTFAAIDSLATNGTNGQLVLSDGRAFTTAGNFQNSGIVDVRAGSTFAVNAAGTLQNLASGTLSGGEFRVGGTLSAPNLNLTNINTTVMLDGVASDIVNTTTGTSALAGVSTVGGQGRLTIQNGRDLTTSGDITVAQGGRVNIGAGTRLTVNGTVTNFATGVFTDGRFDIDGVLQFNNAAINEVDAEFTLSDVLADVQDENGQSAFQNLNTIRPNGNLGVTNGRGLTLNADLALNGTLRVGTAGSPTQSIVSLPTGALNQNGGTLVLDNGRIDAANGYNFTSGTLRGNGSINGNLVSGGFLSPGFSPGALFVTGDLQQRVDGTMNMEIGGPNQGAPINGFDFVSLTGQLSFTGAGDRAGVFRAQLIDGFVPVLGQSFEVLRFGTRTGEFATYEGMAVPGWLRFDVVWTSTSMLLVVVPAPAAGMMIPLLAVAAMRRRRSA